jgi:predicted phosphodiesterase
MGDSRSGPKIFDKITDKMASHKPNFALYLGDLAFKKDYNYWEDEFFITNNENFIANVPFYNAVGNHEGWKQNTEAFTDAPKSASNHKAYYSFDWGDIHFLMLSTEHSISAGTAQYKFAVEDLKNSKAKWKIVSFHIPAYGAGAHGENKNMIEFSKNVIDKNNVTMVLTGHSHFYQHNKVNGISHFILGGGGSPLYPPATNDYTLKSEKKYHYALFDVTVKQIKMTIIDKDGNKLDEIKFN